VEYCFDNTPAYEEDVGELRSFIVLYTAYKTEILWKSDDSQALLETTREYLRGFMGS
jgi:hypothetical protein